MKNSKILKTITTVVATTIIFFACKKESNDVTPQQTNQTAKVNFHLTDAPAEYDALYIDIQKIEITMEGSAKTEVPVYRPGVYNLLTLKNGIDTLLAQAELQTGKISQIRLVLGANNSVVVDGKTYALNTPSAQQSGFKLNLNQDLQAGGAYNIWLDFDAGSSVVATGSGKYNLKPTVKAFAEETNGRIKGFVLPGSALVTVYASNGVETYTAIPNDDGFYMFQGLEEGSYTITYDASIVLFTDVTLNNINVTYGQTTDLGTTVLVQ